MHAIRKDLADLARRIAVTADGIADTYEHMTQMSPVRAESLRARVQASQQFAKAEREIAERYEALGTP